MALVDGRDEHEPAGGGRFFWKGARPRRARAQKNSIWIFWAPKFFCQKIRPTFAKRKLGLTSPNQGLLEIVLTQMNDEPALGPHGRPPGAQRDARSRYAYTISFARIRVGDISATGVFGESEYAISARGRAGGIMKVLVDGEASFSTRGTIKDGYPVPTTFTSKIVSDAETSDVTMVLDEGSAKELAATAPPSQAQRDDLHPSDQPGLRDCSLS